MDLKYNAIVTRAVPYRESDLMLTLFTLERGIVSACLRGAKSAKSKLKFAGELFCFGEYVLSEKDNRRYVKEVNQIDSFYALRLDEKKFFCSTAVLEFVNAFMLDGIQSYDLFLEMIKLFKAYKEKNVQTVKLLDLFYLKALNYQGYALEFDNCCRCGGAIETSAFFCFDNGNSVCKNCAVLTDNEIRINTYKFFHALSNNEEFVEENSNNQDEEKSEKSNAEVYALKFLDYYIRLKSGIEIKSHKMLLSVIG